MQRIKRLSPLAGLALLLLIGALVALAAPQGASNTPAALLAASGSHATASATTARSTQAANGVHKNAPGSSGQPTRAPLAPTATAPAPTDTPVPPTPTATNTPAPSWHTIGSYSGSGGQTLPSFATGAPWRMEWTCTPAAGTGFSFSFTADGAMIGGFGDACDGSSPSSGTWASCADGSCGSHTFDVSVGANGSESMCAWTATIEEWY